MLFRSATENVNSFRSAALTDAAIAAIIADAEGRGAAAREPAPAARKRGLWSVLAR